jgi:RimJ/RimL family protein N-acetyltransferase
MMQIGMSHEVGELIATQIGIGYTAGPDNCLGVFKDGKALGGVVFTNYNYVNVDVHWAGVEGHHWMTKKVLWAIADYCFNQLGCQRITASEDSADTHLIRMVEHMGFYLEATLHGYYQDGDRLFYVMRRDTCPWLKYGERYGKQAESS